MTIKSTRIIGSIKGTKFASTKRTGGGTLGESGTVTNGLIIYYDFGNSSSWPGSGTTVTDLSGTSNTGTIAFTGTAPAYSTENGINSIVFIDSFSQYLYTTTLYTNPQSFTISAWFKTAVGLNKIIGFESNQTGTVSASYDRQLYLGSDGKLYFGIYDGSISTTKYAISSSTYRDNNWHHVAGTYVSGGTMALYIDGVLVSTSTAANAQVYNGYWRIAGYKAVNWTNGSDGYYVGNIGIVQVYNRGLSAAEVLQNFNDKKSRFGF